MVCYLKQILNTTFLIEAFILGNPNVSINSQNLFEGEKPISPLSLSIKYSFSESFNSCLYLLDIISKVIFVKLLHCAFGEIQKVIKLLLNPLRIVLLLGRFSLFPFELIFTLLDHLRRLLDEVHINDFEEMSF